MNGARPGGRTARTRVAVLQATREILIEDGYRGLTWELLAARSGVHRSTIYRRWGTLSALVAELAAQYEADLTAPDTGSLVDDLQAAAHQLAGLLTPGNARVVQSLLGWGDADVQRVLDRFWEQRRQETGIILDRAGMVADAALMMRLVAGPLYYSALIESRQPTAEDAVAAATAAAAWLETRSR